METSEIELIMLIGDKCVKIYEKDKEIKQLKEVIHTLQLEIEVLKEDGRLESPSIK